jgi:hypothetical protein
MAPDASEVTGLLQQWSAITPVCESPATACMSSPSRTADTPLLGKRSDSRLAAMVVSWTAGAVQGPETLPGPQAAASKAATETLRSVARPRRQVVLAARARPRCLVVPIVLARWGDRLRNELTH